MAHDDRTPDFEDLLAAFDIPDVPSMCGTHREQDYLFNGLLGGRSNMFITNSYRISDKKINFNERNLTPTSKLTLGTSVKRPLSSKPHTVDESAASAKRFQSSGYREDDVESAPRTPQDAVISNNTPLSPPSDLGDEATYQLSTNALPPYVPTCPPDKFKLTFPSEGFKCEECGDKFLLQSSLLQHLQRRSVYISFNCESCKEVLVYYNRCNLLRHIQSHREKNQPSDIKKAEVAPLPRELIDHVPSPPAAAIEVPAEVVRTSSSGRGGQASSAVVNGSSRLGKVGVKDSAGRFRCSECSQFFESAAAIEDHFGRSQNMPLATSQCSKCSMTCPSKCSLSAHQRIHLQSMPFVCPECGQKISENWTAFQSHLSIKCLHYSRSIGYKCSICISLFGAAELLRQHIIAVHGDAYYKCQACPMAFKSGTTFDTHKKTSHLTMDVQCKMIFKCPLCDTVFHSSEQLHTHLDVHIKEQIKATKFLFKCLECYKLLESKPALVGHLREVHPSAVNKEVCVECGHEFDDGVALAVHVKNEHSSLPDGASPGTREVARQNKVPTHQGLTQCKQCERVFQTGHGYNIHKQRCHGNAVFLICFVCNKKCASRLELAVHGRQHQKEGALLCTVCSNLTFESRNGLAKHLDAHAGNMKLPAKCDYCGLEMETVDVVASHLKMEHGFSSFRCDKCDSLFHTTKSLTRHQRVMHNPGGPCRKYVCWICKERDFGKRSLLEKHIVTVHKVLAKNIDYSQMMKLKRPPIKIKIPRPVYMAAVQQNNQEREAIVDAVATLPKKLRVSEDSGLYVCFKCDFTAAGRDAFIDHIAQHKTERSSYQCQECGACFVVKPSLLKHLSIIHKIADPEGCSVDEDDFRVGSTNPLACEVCGREFPSDLPLKAHLRTHGMAFIRSRRLVSTSESSPSSS